MFKCCLRKWHFLFKVNMLYLYNVNAPICTKVHISEKSSIKVTFFCLNRLFLNNGNLFLVLHYYIFLYHN